MGMFSRRKGIKGEFLFQDLCRAEGFENVKRMGQKKYQTGAEQPDVDGLPYIHIECKFQERLNLRAAMEQSERDARDEGRGYLPIVAHKKSRQPWLITMRAHDWFRLYRAAIGLPKRNASREKKTTEQG